MAANATNRNPGRMARVIHFMVPSRRGAIMLVTTEAILAFTEVPLGLHLAIGLTLHLLIEALEPAH